MPSADPLHPLPVPDESTGPDAPIENEASSSERRLGDLLALLRARLSRWTVALTHHEQDLVVLDAIRRQSAVTGYATEYLVNLLLQSEPEDTRPIIARLVASGRVGRESLGHWAGPDQSALRVQGAAPGARAGRSCP